MPTKKTSKKPSRKEKEGSKGNEKIDLPDFEERYKLFISNFHGIAFQGKMDFTPIFFHGAVEEITGHKEEEFIAGEVRWDHLIHPFDKDESFENIRLIPNYSIEREYRILHKDGKIRWIHEFIQNICDDSGKPVMVQGTLYEVTAHKQAELALKESEERYRTLAEASHDMIFIINRSDEVEYVNNFAAKQMGFLPKDIIGKKRSTLFPPEIAKNQGFNLQNVFKTGNPAHMEGKALFQGRTGWLDTWLVPLSDKEGGITSVMGISRDISEHKRVEATLEASEKKYSTLVEKGNDGIVIIQDGLVKFFNSVMSEMTGYSREDGIGKPFINYISPTSKKLVFERYEKRLAGENVPDRYELEIISKSSKNIPVEINASIIDYDGKPADMAILRDITDRKRTEKALEAALMKAEDEKNRTEAIISALGDGIIIQDTDYKIIYQNQIQNEIYGEHLGEFCYKVYENRDTICEDCPVELTFKDGKIHKSERAIPTDNGIKYFELTSSALRDPSGKIIAGVKVVRDMTELKRMEGALRERERFLNGIFESIHEGIGVLDKDMNVISVNSTVEKWYPHRMPLVGKKCYEAYHGRKERCELCPAWTSIQTRKPAHEIVPKHGSNGKIVGWVEIYSYPMLDAKTGELTGVIEYVRDITERKRKEETLKLFSEAVETALDGIQIVNLDGRIIYSNKAVEKLYGYSRDEFSGKHVNEMNVDTEIAEKVILPSIKQKGSWVGELLVKHKDGSVFPIWLSTSLVMNDKGEPIAMVGVIKDMTERKEVERKLKESHAFLQSIIDGVAEPIMVIDTNYHVKLMNQAARGGLSEIPDNLRCYQISHRSDKPCINSEHPCPLEEVQRTGRPVTVVHEHDTGNGNKRFFEILASPLYDADGVFSGIIESSRDITERKRVQDALRESEKAYRTLSENLPGIVYRIYLRENNRIRFFNKLARTVTGYKEEELSTGEICSIEDIIVPEDRDRVICEVKKAIAENIPFTVEYGLKHKDGSIRYMFEQGTPIYYNDEPLYIDGVIYDNTQRKHAEEALKASEKRYRMLFESAADAIFILEAEGENAGRILDANHAAAEMHGFTHEELLEMKIMDLDTPDASNDAPNLIRRIMNGKRIQKEITHKRKDGSIFPVEINAGLLKIGNHRYILAFDKDISKRKKAEAELFDRMRQAALAADVGAALNQVSPLEMILTHCAEALVGHLDAAFARIWTFNSDENVLELRASAGMYTHTNGGHKRIPMGLYKIGTIAKDRKPHLTNNVLQDPLVHDQEWARREGLVSFAGYPLLIEGRLVGVMALFARHPLAESAILSMAAVADNIALGIVRKRTEKELGESEEKFRNIVEQSGDGIVLTDEQGIIIEWNRAQEKIIGLNRGEVISRPIWDVQFQCAVPEKKTNELYNKLKTRLQELIQTGKSPLLNRLSENDIMRPDGTMRSLQVQVFIVKTDRGFKTGSIIRDVTDIKRTEEAIRKYASDLEESNKMKELFTDIMHHDLLNPINTVGGFVEILKEEENVPRKKMYFETIERNLAKGVELLENATTLSKLESLKNIEFETIDIAEVIGRNIENIEHDAQKAGLVIENLITRSMPSEANKIIEEVFSNLLSNAIKYASGGKKIIVDSKETDGFWRVDIVDFGAGIKDSEKTLIFERFRRLERKGVKGSGLGLAISKKIMELHNGRIWVEDNPEGGAVFVVEIPKKSS